MALGKLSHLILPAKGARTLPSLTAPTRKLPSQSWSNSSPSTKILLPQRFKERPRILDSEKKVVQSALSDLKVDRIDIMVSNAGMTDYQKFLPAAQIDKELFDYHHTANAWGPFSLAMESIPLMKPGGRFINITAGGSKKPLGDPALLLSAAKASADAIVRSLALTYGPEKGITVNSVSVGSTISDAFEIGTKAFGPIYREMSEKFSPLGRVAQPEEVASIVSFVASPEASWINGEIIPEGLLNAWILTPLSRKPNSC